MARKTKQQENPPDTSTDNSTDKSADSDTDTDTGTVPQPQPTPETKPDSSPRSISDLIADQLENENTVNDTVADKLVEETRKESDETGGTETGSESETPMAGQPTVNSTGVPPGSFFEPEKLTDSEGTVFDPSIHTNHDGKPTITSSGKFRRKRGVGDAKKSTLIKSGSIGGITAAPDKAVCEANARVIVGTMEMLGCGFFGEEWQASNDERKVMVDAYTNYFIVTGNVDLPPWAGIAIATASYVLPRLMMPNTQDKINILLGRKKPIQNPNLPDRQ